MWANKRTFELSWVLRKIAGGLDGGEREQRALAPATATMAAGSLGWRAGDEGGGFYMPRSASRGDER
jgi:hypothetical protein